ncbi:MAG: VanW family protein [Ruthenibacterium lactatiformans]|uniref:VanW family protein n=1 Tax=Ruthenibacterium lactatiformans TaxID=1550024 RepID=UPI0039953D57
MSAQSRNIFHNETLGQRRANGYRLPGAGERPEGRRRYLKISSTLYLAVLRSNLEIVSRTNHMFYPGYIPYGMDATVSWGGPDFKFRNNTDYPIKLSVTYSGGKATCTIYGTNLSGQSVKMEYNILSSTPYETVEKEDKSLAPGTRKQEQNGYTGYKVATYRCVYDKNGKLVSRTLEANSTYKSRNQIFRGAGLKIPAAQEDQETETTCLCWKPAAGTAGRRLRPRMIRRGRQRQTAVRRPILRCDAATKENCKSMSKAAEFPPRLLCTLRKSIQKRREATIFSNFAVEKIFTDRYNESIYWQRV